MAALESTARAATRAAALACRRWVGRARDADAAVAEAMRTVVVGEGAKGHAPMLYDGKRFGRGGGALDIAVDPLEGAKLCAKGLPGSPATIAFAQRGWMERLGCSSPHGQARARARAGEALGLGLGPE